MPCSLAISLIILQDFSFVKYSSLSCKIAPANIALFHNLVSFLRDTKSIFTPSRLAPVRLAFPKSTPARFLGNTSLILHTKRAAPS